MVAQNAPQPLPLQLPLNGAMSVGAADHPDVVWTTFPDASTSDADAPRIRLAAVQPLPPSADGPDLEVPDLEAPAASAAPADQPTSDKPPTGSDGSTSDYSRSANPHASTAASPDAAKLAPLPPIAPAPQSLAPQAPTPQAPVTQAAEAPAVQSATPPTPEPATQPTAPGPTAPGPIVEAKPSAPPMRTDEIEAVARQANTQTARGFQLGRRGATYSARSELVAALSTIAAALDSAGDGNTHERMLAAGMQALDEADDFAARASGLTSEVDLSRIVISHQTPVLKNAPLKNMSCSAAMSRYLTFAQEQLAGCSRGIPDGSAALYGLGRLYAVPEAMHGPVDATRGAKSVALYQAALLVDSRNYRAANELGVLLARFGRLPEARLALLHSLSISAQATTWQNLAAVHESLGERDLAARAHHEAMLAASRQHRGTAGQSIAVEWLDPATFAATTPPNIDGTPPPRTAQQPTMTAGAPTTSIR